MNLICLESGAGVSNQRKRRTQASAADLENAGRVIIAEPGGDYFSLRELDSEIGILNRTVQALQKGFDLVNSRTPAVCASGLDVAQEETAAT